MTYDALAVNIVIASPGDVAAERNVIERVVHRWNSMFSKTHGVVLVPRRWETAAAEMGAPPQRIIDRQMIEDGDILIGVFWTRLGTPTGDHVSGTAAEIEQFLATGRAASLFFSSMPAVLGKLDTDQWQALQNFREEMERRGLVGIVEIHDQLADDVLMSINHHVQELISHRGSAAESPGGPAPPAGSVTTEADVRPSFYSLGGGNSVLTLTNYGSAAARDVVVTTRGTSKPEQSWDILGTDEPIPILSAGGSIELRVALHFGSPPRVLATVTWTNPDGSAGSSVETLAL
jgi:hypothetical protein